MSETSELDDARKHVNRAAGILAGYAQKQLAQQIESPPEPPHGMQLNRRRIESASFAAGLVEDLAIAEDSILRLMHPPVRTG